MTTSRRVAPHAGGTTAPRPFVAPLLALITLALAGCSTSAPTPSAPTATPRPSVSVAPTPTPSPTPTPAPTPRFTNEPDAELTGLIPATAGGAAIVIPPNDEFALTPGDVGSVYGEIGARFASLALAYIEQPRLTLYAMRVDGEPVATADLEPHLAEIGRYVGIAGLDPEPWELSEAGGHEVWVRPEDNATALGTMIYTWSSGEYVFLLIGVDDTVNRALIAELPGTPPPTPTPRPTRSPGAGGSAVPSASGAPSPAP